MLIQKIQKKLPYLFKIAEIEVSKGGRVGMEVGTLREKMIIALLMYKFGIERVQEVPITQHETDVIIVGHQNPISIKTKTNTSFRSVKLIWTVDWSKVEYFYENYEPKTDIILITIKWCSEGMFCYIPKDNQIEVFNSLGRDKYINKPRKGTNPRGIEINPNALKICVDKSIQMGYYISVNWFIPHDLEYNPYIKWIELWKKK
ncbi:MAG: ThaI family type II restriction endonuclease [Leptospiraceae bacterium]|nr:ThaI family type II restriction endonuclease [Leptospiraceae bacterium]